MESDSTTERENLARPSQGVLQKTKSGIPSRMPLHRKNLNLLQLN
jgi:hypothetical protein